MGEQVLGNILPILVIAGLVLAWKTWKWLGLRKNLLPPSPANALSSGPAAVCGRVVPLAELSSPVTGRACAAYQRRVETRDPSLSKRRAPWGEVTCRLIGAFLVDDGTGQALVWPESAVFVCAQDSATRREFHGAGAGGETKESERVLQAGDTVYVCGTARSFADFMERLRQDCGYLPPEVLTELRRREAELAGLPCFFAGDPFMISGQDYAALSGRTLPDTFES